MREDDARLLGRCTLERADSIDVASCIAHRRIVDAAEPELTLTTNDAFARVAQERLTCIPHRAHRGALAHRLAAAWGSPGVGLVALHPAGGGRTSGAHALRQPLACRWNDLP